MSSRPWYKRYPSDFISGTILLSAEEKGVYAVLLDLMYDRHAPITDEPRELARICGCTTRRFGQIRDKLIELGKITRAEGSLTNPRFENQSRLEQSEHEKLGENARRF